VIQTVDYHTGGEPFRIVTAGATPLEGGTILDKRRFARDSLGAGNYLLQVRAIGYTGRSWVLQLAEGVDADEHRVELAEQLLGPRPGLALEP